MNGQSLGIAAEEVFKLGWCNLNFDRGKKSRVSKLFGFQKFGAKTVHCPVVDYYPVLWLPCTPGHRRFKAEIIAGGQFTIYVLIIWVPP